MMQQSSQGNKKTIKKTIKKIWNGNDSKNKLNGTGVEDLHNNRKMEVLNHDSRIRDRI